MTKLRPASCDGACEHFAREPRGDCCTVWRLGEWWGMSADLRAVFLGPRGCGAYEPLPNVEPEQAHREVEEVKALKKAEPKPEPKPKAKREPRPAPQVTWTPMTDTDYRAWYQQQLIAALQTGRQINFWEACQWCSRPEVEYGEKKGKVIWPDLFRAISELEKDGLIEALRLPGGRIAAILRGRQWAKVPGEQAVPEASSKDEEFPDVFEGE